ncbi:MFS transporter [Xylanimonas allomyrinae]|uniref:MFS transporter n=1 Tax=Xylanimonas allomyrinae TaxID=2509459 RepID=A0A4P6ENN9_9MICO|nr:MFS transporter [Xylanimonas allomyrinae]QAY64470.1 MFS transporter [Xylanimonas allomyrinae]
MTSPSPTVHDSRRWWILATVAIAQLMVVLDATVVNIAMPSAQAELVFSDNDRQWVVTAYALAFGSLLLLGGRLSDLVGRRRTFIIGLIGFAGASALGGASQSFGMLVGARTLQGAFGAVLAPAALSVLTTTFVDPKERSRAFGVFGGLAGAGGAIGLLLGGFLTEHLDWRWTLYINLVFAALAVAGGLTFLHATRGRAQRLDVAGAALGGAGLFALVYGFSRAEPEGWGSLWTWGPLVASAVLLTAFVLRQRAAGHDALLPLRVVLDRNRGASFLAILVAGAGMFGAFLFGTFYLQTQLGYSPWETGLAFLPQILVLATCAQLCTNIFLPRFGPKVMVPIGLGLAAVGLAMLTRIDLQSTFVADVLPGLMIMGAGMGTAMPAAIQTATLGVDRDHAGVASAVVSTSQQVGGALGTAVLNTIATSAASAYVTAHATTNPPAGGVLARAAIDSYTTAFGVSALIFAGGSVLTGLLFRRRAAAQAAGGPAAAEVAEVRAGS